MLKPEDIMVDTYRPSKRSGLRVGVDYGVKVTHKPTGIFVVEDSERSQHRNRAIALQKLEKLVADAQTTGAAELPQAQCDGGKCGIGGYCDDCPTPQADSQPAPEYVGNGMFKGETIEKAAEHWANWCDRRCMNGLAEFLRVVAARAPAESVTAPGGGLHPKTANLVQRFAAALAEKLAAAEKKYGYSDGWSSPDWMDECRQKLAEHVVKGDPRDVAAYCAFLWHHEASTAPIPPAQAADSVREDAARWQWLADYLVGERTDLDEGIVACATIDALRQFADAARKQGANHD